jgi:site-specific DNA-methyltransferase (adenine-specific)
VLDLFPETESGSRLAGFYAAAGAGVFGKFGATDYPDILGNSGSAARFFYCAKASSEDRNAGLSRKERNNHPTVKPTDLMRYLVRLVTPAGGLVLDPYTGSGSTGRACGLEGFRFIGAELGEESHAIASKRIAAAYAQKGLFNAD